MTRTHITVCLLSALAASAQTSAIAANSPNFAREPVVVEYDVDPTWPQQPEHVSPDGWVSGMAMDSENRIWFLRKGPDPVQVYRTDGTFVRTWGKDSFIDPHFLRIDHEGNIWISDFSRHISQKYSLFGRQCECPLAQLLVQSKQAAAILADELQLVDNTTCCILFFDLL